MTVRKYRMIAESGEHLLKRSAVLPRAIPASEVPAWVAQAVGDGREALLSAGANLEWYSPETDEERERREAHERASAERTERWEREVYARLRAKFEADA
jgi:hypothetical protein